MPYELPIYLMMATGGRHDAPLGLFAMHRATQVFGYNVENACFDAAHDATEFYMLGKDYWETNFFIPLNSTNSGNLIAGVAVSNFPRICRWLTFREPYIS